MFDNICKFLAEEFSSDIASWLLGEPVPLAELSPRELSIEPIRTDSLILRQSSDVVLHAEFQTQPDAEIPFRMADYRLRVYRRYPNKTMRQVVIYLKESRSQFVYQNTFVLERLRHEFDVIRLWEQPTALFLERVGLLPFAILTRAEEKTTVLRQVAEQIQAISDRRVRANVFSSSTILAGLVLNERNISQILRSEIMQESVIYQQIKQEGREEGLAQGLTEGLERGLQRGIQEGRQMAIAEIALNLLRGGMTVEQVVGFTGLSPRRVRELQQSLEGE